MPNRLAQSKSPYLLQHATNPVDWWPWSATAFDAAQERDVPVFLSIGYATCHWCHVMEHESFEDLEVARLMNDAFVCIKVDREERPDIDTIYMTACQMTTGSGGWPLTVILTPDKRPFFSGTYFPKQSHIGRIGMMDLIPRIQEVWRDRRQDVEQQALQLTSALVRNATVDTGGELPGEESLHAAFEELRSRYDNTRGGFGSAPKFPSPHVLRFLLRYWKRTGQSEALSMVKHTLERMRSGGIFDHVGFGFHRYSTDADWLLPHFEKMLYDQALHILAYTEAFQATGKGLYEKVAREVIAYVLRDLTTEEGAFECAEDADSEGKEGKFYVWHEEELKAVLGEALADEVSTVFNVQPEGNFLDEATRKATGENILHGPGPFYRRRLQTARARLFAHRLTRIRPSKDDKVLCDWNGLMIAALARAARVLDDREYLRAARRAARFIEEYLLKDGRLLHRWRDGEAAITGMLDDYAFFIDGLLELFEADAAPHDLELALSLATVCNEQFLDTKGGGFHLTAGDAESLLVRSRQGSDGALPSGNGVMMMNLVRLAHITGQTDYLKQAQAVAAGFQRSIAAQPAGHVALLAALDLALGPANEVVVCGNRGAADLNAMLRSLHSSYLPRTVIITKETDAAEQLQLLSPLVSDRCMVDGMATAYVCRDFACNLPTTRLEDMMKQLEHG